MIMRSATLGPILAGVTASIVAVTGTAAAADLDRPRYKHPPAAYAPVEPIYGVERWTGFYLGGTLGQSFGAGLLNGDLGSYTFDLDGTVGTIFAGYNWQVGSAVIGLETDVGTGNSKASALTGFGKVDAELYAMGSFRARAGLLVTPALLVYGTAGLAWSNMDFTVAGLDTNSRTLWGYQVGAGAEFMVSSNVGLRLEYIYTDLEAQRVDQLGISNVFDPDHHTVRAGVSFKF
jgi:outer membrane immunogenic protein